MKLTLHQHLQGGPPKIEHFCFQRFFSDISRTRKAFELKFSGLLWYTISYFKIHFGLEETILDGWNGCLNHIHFSKNMHFQKFILNLLCQKKVPIFHGENIAYICGKFAQNIWPNSWSFRCNMVAKICRNLALAKVLLVHSKLGFPIFHSESIRIDNIRLKTNVFSAKMIKFDIKSN